MTISFIAKTYHVPEKVIFDALSISPQGNHDKNLRELNQKYFPETDEKVLNLVKAIILAHQPPPTPVSAPPTVPPLKAPAAP
jgi:hypothetical protein